MFCRLLSFTMASLAGVSSAVPALADKPHSGNDPRWTASEFNSMPVEEQRAAIVSAIEYRLKHAGNLSYEVDLELTISNNKNGKPSGVKEVAAFRRCRAWRHGGSFRVESDMFEPGHNDDVTQWVNSGFDGSEGVARSTVRFSNGHTPGGRIDTVPDRIIIDDRYAYYLDGNYPHEEEFLLRELLKFRDEWDLAATGKDTVQIVVPFKPWWEKKPGGKRVIDLNPEKGFLPIAGESRWDGKDANGIAHWRIERFVVEESQNVDGVWMPTRLHEEIASSASPETIAVYDTKVTAIEHGEVTAENLYVPFTKGMEIVDAIRAVTYVSDANGNPAGPTVAVYGAGELSAVTPESATNRGLLIGINVAVVIALAIAVLYARRKALP